ncbi:septal ring lytic transglycosylase RlpA family protein [Acetobacter estunensis]|nr:septal ring lytic transglycosylase RlpA family protein [Acetobacter estunensis]
MRVSGFAVAAMLGCGGAAVEAQAAETSTMDTSSTLSSHTSWAASVRAALTRRAEGVATMTRRVQHGMASWYGGRFAHRRTASGNRFDPTELTAAHPSAPLGSRLLVRSEDTGRAVVVTVRDRGPYSHGRIIDLSHAAAEQLGMLHSGVAHVSVHPLTEQEAIEVAEAPER